MSGDGEGDLLWFDSLGTPECKAGDKYGDPCEETSSWKGVAEAGGVSCLILSATCETTREAVGAAADTAELSGRVTMELKRRRCLSNMSFLGLCGLGTQGNEAGKDVSVGNGLGTTGKGTGEEPSLGNTLEWWEEGLVGFEFGAVPLFSPAVFPSPVRDWKVMSEGRRSSSEE